MKKTFEVPTMECIVISTEITGDVPGMTGSLVPSPDDSWN